MQLSGRALRVRVYLGELDHYHHRSLSHAIVERAREEGLAGATVLHGIEGFGASRGVVHTSRILTMSDDLPVVVEIIDTEDRVREFLTILEEIVTDCLVTVDEVHVHLYQGVHPRALDDEPSD